MNKKIIGSLAIAGLTICLAGCGSQAANKQTNGQSSSTSLIAQKSTVKISATNMSPQETVSLITAYSGNKFGNDWATVAKQGQKDGLKVNLYRSTHYQLSDGGQGVAYNVTAGGKNSGLVYTVNGNDVTIYQNAQPNHSAQKLATIRRSAMVNYINKNGQGMLVNTLAKNAQVIDKTNGGLSTPSASDNNSSNDTGKYGNEGAFDVPSEMQGTWYSADYDSNSTVTFKAHSMTSSEDGETTTLKLYKQGNQFLAGDDVNNKTIIDATKDWGSAKMMHVNNLDFLNIRGWCQSAGDGDSFAVHTETINGKSVKVLVLAGGAGFWTNAIYYQSQDLAKQQADTHYDDLIYQDDE